MKQMVSLMLVLSMVLSLFAGCGSTQTEEKMEESMVAATTAEISEPTTEPTTEPTLSPEEVLYNSLPDRMKQAVDAGLVELSQLEDLERIVTVGEASAMLQKAYVHRTGVESKTLNELMEREEYASRNATRGWLSAIPGLADMELVQELSYENYEQWLELMAKNVPEGAELANAYILAWHYSRRLGTGANGYISGLKMPDEAAAFEDLTGDPLYSAERYLHDYGFTVYNDTNGRKFITPDENGEFNVLGELTMAEVVESALIFYHYPNVMAIPEFVALEDATSYNTDIITAELLGKETDLPAASCGKLPAEWHGVVMDDLNWVDYNVQPDNNVYEYEIKAVKEAGFNFIGLDLDFSWLQDYLLFDPGQIYTNYVNQEDDGKLSRERLEKLDQIVAWCMEYDIHLNIRASGVGGYVSRHNHAVAVSSGSSKATKSLTNIWRVLAQRYADIPNEYLSFTVFSNPGVWAQEKTLMSAVEAIQEVSPERCLMVEIYGSALRAEPFAKKGVALSYVLQEPGDVLDHNDYFKYDFSLARLVFAGEKIVESFTWPYEDMDAEKAFAKKHYFGESLDEVAAVAEKYGMGFMLGNFGIHVQEMKEAIMPDKRYPDEAYKAMIVDVTSTIGERGYGWCFAHWFGYFGIASNYPAYDNATYTQVEDYQYYLDEAMVGWFREINSAN